MSDAPKRRGRRARRRQVEDDDDGSDNESKKVDTPKNADNKEESKSSAKKGRRRGRAGRNRRREDDDDSSDDEDSQRNTGWGNSSGRKPKRDRAKDKHKTAANWDDEAEGNDTIMVIPTLSSEDEEDVKGPDKDAIAQAPQASTLLPRTNELDEDIKSILPTATASGIDLSILTACLVPQNLILEEDEPWNFDELLQEVAIELQEEAEDKNQMMSTTPGVDDDPNDF